ncbi:uncharacterized protein [Antedon mediterranea]|uniref:uncharacterized protein n=1 Tax=Antedon mediterranea TaxID=105859 RepID=UPI003AF44E69
MECICSDGWTGEYCSEPCPVGVYGQDCQHKCPSCSNGGTCDPVTGECDCAPGWKGVTCAEECTRRTYGKDCDLHCSDCADSCHPLTGECQCDVGYGDRDCSEICADGTDVQCGWFPNCCRNMKMKRELPTTTKESTIHDLITTTVNTTEFEMLHFASHFVLGLLCLFLVNSSSSLELGAKNVLSRNVTKWGISTIIVEVKEYELEYCEDIQCRILTGTTTQSEKVCNQYIETELYCRPGFHETGNSCENDCEKETSLLQVCDHKCCQNGGSCRSINGNIKCICSSGWTGEYCSEPCPVGVYGQDCQHKCPSCSNGGTCDPVTGECDCAPGWKGVTCGEECTRRTYGKDCDLHCSDCVDSCHPLTGECQCDVGYGDIDCSETCADGVDVQCGWFPNCCRNNATCEATVEYSRCACQPGYEGKYCEKRCINWGPDCVHTCLCINGGTCHPETGECYCNAGWGGKHCEESEADDQPPGCAEKCQAYGCNEDGTCKCSSRHVWDEDASICKLKLGNTQVQSVTQSIKTTLVVSKEVPDGPETPRSGKSHSPTTEGEELTTVSIALIVVCGTLSVFVVIALICSLKNQARELRRWTFSNENKVNKKRVHRMSSVTLPLPLPPSPKTQANPYLLHTRFKTSDRVDAYEDNIRPTNQQPVQEEVTYSTVGDAFSRACGRLPNVVENEQGPPYSPSADVSPPFEVNGLSREGSLPPYSPSADVSPPFEVNGLSREGSLRSGVNPSCPTDVGFLQRQNSRASTYEGSIRPFSRSASVVSTTDSFYEDMTRTSRSASLCRPTRNFDGIFK